MLYGEYRNGGSIRVEVDTVQDGISAWTKRFDDATHIRSLLLELAPDEFAKVNDFIKATVTYGEGHVVIHCAENDFSKYGFEKMPPA
jgi:hypothetical protein